MLRLTIALLVAIAVCETAEGAAGGAGKAAPRYSPYRGWRYTATILPAGLPRRHYDFRTTVSDREPSAYRRPHDRSGYSWLERGPHDDGRYVPRWDRLPYTCGVYGYC